MISWAVMVVRTCVLIATVIASLLAPSLLGAQEHRAAPAFEVATVKPGDPNARDSSLNLDEDGVRVKSLPLIDLLQFAYNLNSGSKDQIVGEPAWVSSATFDINAKDDEGTALRIGKMSPDERMTTLREMVRALLEERFQLKVHPETRELPVLALTIAKGGSKLLPARHAAGSSQAHEPDDWQGLRNPRRGRTVGHSATMQMLVNALSSKSEIGGRLVIDQTGLKGEYNFDLTWTPDDGADSAAGPSLFAALQEQLGLRLQSTRAPVDCIVIDHVEQPSPN